MFAGFQPSARMIAYVWIVGVGVTKIISVSAPLALQPCTSCEAGVGPPSTSTASSPTTWLFDLRGAERRLEAVQVVLAVAVVLVQDRDLRVRLVLAMSRP